MKILINEKQIKLIKDEIIKEAVGFGFSIEYLKQLTSLKKRYDYCKQFLGNPIGRGSSRIVFQYDDNIVIKLALNKAGLAQNEEEYRYLDDNFINVFPKSYDYLSDLEGYKFIATEYVLPAKEEDFEHVFGFDFLTFCNIICTWESWKDSKFIIPLGKHKLKDEEMEYFTENIEDVREFEDYFLNYNIEGIGDLLRLSSYGMTNRNGQPEIVILDNGLNNEIYNKFYKHKMIKK